MSCVGTRVKYIGKNCCITNQKGTIVEDYDIKMAIVEFDMGGIYIKKTKSCKNKRKWG